MPECVFCLEESEPADLEVYAQNRIIRLCMSKCECNGFIHVKCLQQWISINPVHKTKCPICRTPGENFTLLECESISSRPTTRTISRTTTRTIISTRHATALAGYTTARTTSRTTPTPTPTPSSGSTVIVVARSASTSRPTTITTPATRPTPNLSISIPTTHSTTPSRTSRTDSHIVNISPPVHNHQSSENNTRISDTEYVRINAGDNTDLQERQRTHMYVAIMLCAIVGLIFAWSFLLKDNS